MHAHISQCEPKPWNPRNPKTLPNMKTLKPTFILYCRMESTSQPGCIHVSAATAELLGPGVPLVSTGGVEVKGKVSNIVTW